MENIKEVVFEVRDAMVTTLSEQVMLGLDRGAISIGNNSNLNEQGDKLFHVKAEVVKNFGSNLARYFNVLVLDEGEKAGKRFGSLSLVTEEDLDAIIALEGMIAHCRNSEMREYLAFTTRLDSLFYGTHIDESNNPMDPEQIGDAFKKALQPVGLNPTALLLCYRGFNRSVFNELEAVLEQANLLLIDRGVLPKLDIAARNKIIQKSKRSRRREKADPVERAFASETPSAPSAESPQIFSMMQNLMHRLGPAAAAPPAQVQAPEGVTQAMGVPQPVAVPQSAFPQQGEFPGTGKIPVVGFDYGSAGGEGSFALQPGMMVGNQKVEVVPAEQLTSVLSKLQVNLDAMTAGQEGGAASEPVDLNASIGELLSEEGGEDTLNALDNVSADVINLITLIYQAIWQDHTVQIPIKELLGRTQITALKIALDDPAFFDKDDHPGRMLINELATAGISWTDFEKLETDPTYQKMLEVVESLNTNYDGDINFVMSLVVDFQAFKRKLELQNKKAEERLRDATAREQRVEEVKAYTLGKIQERILQEKLDPFVTEFLEVHFHKFLVKVVLKEGPGGVSWKPIMNTVDVLLWSVQPDKDVADKVRFEKLRTRLLQNLQKALQSTDMEVAEVNKQMKGLMDIQKSCFLDAIKKSREMVLAKEREEKAQAEAAKKTASEDKPAPAVQSGEVNILEDSEPASDAVEDEQKFEAEDEVDILAEPEPATEKPAAKPAVAETPKETDFDVEDEEIDILALLEAASKHGDLPATDEHLLQVNKLPLGVWMEFQGDGEQTIRCTLAAKISTIDKYVFVNADGVKTVEKSRMGLAKELKAGSVKIISEAPLVDRAMETIIGKLRDGEAPVSS